MLLGAPSMNFTSAWIASSMLLYGEVPGSSARRLGCGWGGKHMDEPERGDGA